MYEYNILMKPSFLLGVDGDRMGKERFGGEMWGR